MRKDAIIETLIDSIPYILIVALVMAVALQISKKDEVLFVEKEHQ